MASHAQVPRHRAAHSVVLRRGVPAVSVAAVACAAVGLAPGVGHAAPTAGTADARLAAARRIAALYQQAEADTQQYDADVESIARLQEAVNADAGQSAATVRALDQLDGGLGRLAAQQYRDVDNGSSLDLLFTAHPDRYLQQAVVNEREAAAQAGRLHAAEVLQARLAALRELGRSELTTLQQAQASVERERVTVEAELAQARAQLNSLAAADRHAVTADLARGEGGDGFGTVLASRPPSLSSLLEALHAAASASAAADGLGGAGADRVQRAITAAYSEIGKPYVWGAVGPSGFDCSGLMQHAWAQAGVILPRTSEEQAAIGPAVPLDQIRPGDLVIYFSGRTHVGMYVGKGLVIHAPRPGSKVQFVPLRAMPINKIVRPDGA